MKAKEYLKLIKSGEKTLEEVFLLMDKEALELIRVRGSNDSRYYKNSVIAAYKDQNNKAKSILYKMGIEDSSKYARRIWKLSPEMASWVFPELRPDPKIKIGVWFTQLLRSSFPASINLRENQIEDIRTGFEDYLNSLNLSEKVAKDIIPKSLIDIIMGVGHPFKTNGFHPALVLHLITFIEENAANP